MGTKSLIVFFILISLMSCDKLSNLNSSVKNNKESVDSMITDINNDLDTIISSLRRLNDSLELLNEVDSMILYAIENEKPISVSIKNLKSVTVFEVTYKEFRIRSRYWKTIPYEQEEYWFIVGYYKDGRFINIDSLVSPFTINKIKQFCLNEQTKRKS